eukprot:4363394-Prymnesium_polylepis.1
MPASVNPSPWMQPQPLQSPMQQSSVSVLPSPMLQADRLKSTSRMPPPMTPASSSAPSAPSCSAPSPLSAGSRPNNLGCAAACAPAYPAD